MTRNTATLRDAAGDIQQPSARLDRFRRDPPQLVLNGRGQLFPY